jgi:hypothetical protein
VGACLTLPGGLTPKGLGPFSPCVAPLIGPQAGGAPAFWATSADLPLSVSSPTPFPLNPHVISYGSPCLSNQLVTESNNGAAEPGTSFD